MTFFHNEGLSTVLVLAGMIDKPDVKETFAVASSSSFRIDMESLGVDVRRDAPRSGAIGLAALLASMGPLYDMNSARVDCWPGSLGWAFPVRVSRWPVSVSMRRRL